MIQCKIMRQQFRGSAFKSKRLFSLLHVDRHLTNRPHKTTAFAAPVKGLAGIQRHREVEIRRVQKLKSHLRHRLTQMKHRF